MLSINANETPASWVEKFDQGDTSINGNNVTMVNSVINASISVGKEHQDWYPVALCRNVWDEEPGAIPAGDGSFYVPLFEF